MMDPRLNSPYTEENYAQMDSEAALMDPETDILKLDDDVGELQNDEILDTEKPDLPKDDAVDGGEEEADDEGVELSPDGVLDEETVARGLSNLGRSATGDGQVYLNVTIPGFSLTDISLIAEYEHLQKVEIPYNDITDLSPLGKLKFLLVLDASHNRIPTLLDFEPPANLQTVDLSWNKIEEMRDLSAHRNLEKLVLDNNTIPAVQGLEKCKRLKHLSISHNKIKKIQNLNDLPIQHLNLSNNEIRMIENLETLKYLREVNLSGNTIRSLSGLDHNVLLESVDVEDNEVIDIVEINHIKNARNLRDLNLLRNPIQELPDYRLSILFRISRLTTLDRHHVKEQEKVAAINMFDPPREVVASRDHIMHVVYSFLQPSRVWDSTLPNIETPYPMLVLVGPQGSGKKDLSMKLVDEFGDYFGYGISHTTRQPRSDEVAGKDYYFASLEKFEMDIKMGQFIQTYQYCDNWYGLQMESVENVAREGLACVVHMELEGVLTLKNTYFEPRYVLVMPLNAEDHERRLRERGIYTEDQIQKTLKRSDMYVKQNQDHPGFFDMMICSDDITEAYKQMRRLVMDYLGISTTTPVSTAAPYTITDTREVTDAFQGFTGAASSNQMGARTWSKPSIPDSMSQTRGPRVSSGAPVSRGIVEEESIKRRHSAAREVVSGYVPPLYEQLLTNYPKTAPQTVEGQLGLGENGEPRAYSAPINPAEPGVDLGEAGPPASPDSSSSQTSSSSNLSDLDSATELQRGRDGKHNTNSKGLLPTEKVNPLALIDEQGYRSASNTQLPPARPPSAPRPDSKTGVIRPGSNRHVVLPPIQNVA
ncbi:leucine-rich repeat and guanylate kinase domain-containing protein [Aplysia californica]|uniref:Leucine-rich repeat and guanylate kinase domain-containing protein n=1 Tax=Aplysia californica TaxID=6500 RepID=A0ABM0KA93_APLCA|nr:leucine-rich repeat and guanylate kinase domain-containing protein [Aplysia californica]